MKKNYETPWAELVTINLEAGILTISGGEETNVSIALMTLDNGTTFNGWDAN